MAPTMVGHWVGHLVRPKERYWVRKTAARMAVSLVRTTAGSMAEKTARPKAVLKALPRAGRLVGTRAVPTVEKMAALMAQRTAGPTVGHLALTKAGRLAANLVAH